MKLLKGLCFRQGIVKLRKKKLFIAYLLANIFTFDPIFNITFMSIFFSQPLELINYYLTVNIL